LKKIRRLIFIQHEDNLCIYQGILAIKGMVPQHLLGLTLQNQKMLLIAQGNKRGLQYRKE
ncbi:hypothetical protein CHS0354_001591, partial [Potamilus streckersoni]